MAKFTIAKLYCLYFSTSKKFSFDVSVWSFLLWQFHLSVGNPGNSLIWSVFTNQLIFCVYNIWSINYRRSIHHLSAIIVLNFCQVKWVNKNIYRIINSSDYKATLYELLVKVVIFIRRPIMLKSRAIIERRKLTQPWLHTVAGATHSGWPRLNGYTSDIKVKT